MKSTTDSEKRLESALVRKSALLGWLAIKLLSQHFSGLPDRMLLGHGGRIKFVEVKTTGQKPKKRQPFVHALLRSMGFEVWVVDSKETLNELIKTL